MKKEKELTGYASIDMPQNIGYKKSEINPIIPNVNIYTLMKLLCLPHLDRTAVDCKELRVTYNKFMKDAKEISVALKELGVKRNDIVAVDMPNLYQALVMFFACNRIGATATYLNYFAPKEDICEYLNLFESPIFVNYDRSDEYNTYIKNNTKVKHIITLSKNKVNSLEMNEPYNITNDDKVLNYNGLGTIAKYRKNKVELNHNGKENALILFTSGTTGKPKSVVLTNENVISSLIYAGNTAHFDNIDADKLLICVPFSYPYGLVTSALSTVFSTREAILAPDISKDTVAYYYSKNPNLIMGSPALLDLTMRYVPEGQDLSSVNHFISGGDFLVESHAAKGKEFFAKHGAKDVKIGNGYGNAELVSSGATPLGIKNRPETAGKILVGTTAMIVDPKTMEELKYGEEGLLCVSGKHVFKEYYKEPKLTEEVKFVKNGKTYFNTGTYGKLDEEGYFTVTGRMSRFYIMSSLNKIYCDNVQSQLCSLDCVFDAAVVKVPDEELLYVNKAYVVLDDKYKNIEKPDEYINSLLSNTKLKEYEYPTYYEFVDELPRKQGTDKINYSLLEAKSLEEIQKNKKLVLK